MLFRSVPFDTAGTLLPLQNGGLRAVPRGIRLLNVTTGKEVARCVQDGGMNDIAISRDIRRIATAGQDNMIRIWDSQSGAQVATLRGHESAVYSVCFSPDGRRLVSGGDYPDNTLRLWNVALAEQIGRAHV